MKGGPDIALVAALIGEPARADILTALMADQALTATELSVIAGVTKQTVSTHLAKLVDGRLVTVVQQGRHRYFRIADHDVADIVERLMGIAFRTGAMRLRASPREPALRKARVCYDHLAGVLAVDLLERMVEGATIRPVGDRLELTAAGRRGFAELGVDVAALERARRPLLRSCLDWSVRRRHLAGALGAAVLARSLALGWAARSRDSRAVEFSPRGERALWDLLVGPGTLAQPALAPAP